MVSGVCTATCKSFEAIFSSGFYMSERLNPGYIYPMLGAQWALFIHCRVDGQMDVSQWVSVFALLGSGSSRMPTLLSFLHRRYITDQPLVSYCSLLKNGPSVYLPYLFILIASKYQCNSAVAMGIPYISPPSVNHVVMTSELTVRCPVFTGCHGSSEKAHS